MSICFVRSGMVTGDFGLCLLGGVSTGFISLGVVGVIGRGMFHTFGNILLYTGFIGLGVVGVVGRVVFHTFDNLCYCIMTFFIFILGFNL